VQSSAARPDFVSYVAPYGGALGAIAVATIGLAPVRESVNATTVALALLLVILFVAIFWGSKPALLASVMGMLSFNYFFLAPFHTLTIADPQNWIALTAFFVTAVAVGQLSARAKRRAEEAELRRIEIKRLYEELREAFERASEAEALKRSERFKSALLDAVTHDLRTPLTSIKASATLLLEDRDNSEPGEPLTPAEQQALLKVITQESDRLDRFVESIVELARIETGEIALRRNWGPVEEIIDAAVARAEPLLLRHPLTVRVERQLPIIRVDARAVAEVIYTLLDNASKYAPQHTAITIDAERSSGEMVKLSVKDQGPGIPHQLRERVFEKFFREPAVGSAERPEGIGMGLSIAKGIVEAHGGQIWVDDQPGHVGTTVCFTVPVGDDEPASGNITETRELTTVVD